MSNLNTVTVSGNLTRDPEVRWTSEDGSSSVVNLGIAVNRSRKQEDGSYEDETSFFDCDVFGSYANLVARKLRKGDAAAVQGRLEQQVWETDGSKRSKVVIIVSTIDSEGFFRSKDEDRPVEKSSAPETAAAPETTATPTVTDDDIPF